MRFGRYESSEGTQISTAITFLMIGIGVGAGVALLLAPKSGKQLRRDLKRGYEDAREALDDWAEEANDKVRGAAERGVEMAEDLRDRVEPLRKAITRS